MNCRAVLALCCFISFYPLPAPAADRAALIAACAPGSPDIATVTIGNIFKVLPAAARVKRICALSAIPPQNTAPPGNEPASRRHICAAGTDFAVNVGRSNYWDCISCRMMRKDGAQHAISHYLDKEHQMGTGIGAPAGSDHTINGAMPPRPAAPPDGDYKNQAPVT